MRAFRWISEGSIPANCDLRHHGWRLAEAHEPLTDCILILHASQLDLPSRSPSLPDAWHHARRLTLVSGVNAGETRAQLLAEGFGEAVSDSASLLEVDARARRLRDLAGWLPRQRTRGGLELDLLAREAVYLRRPVGLHPLEFALLWRLCETPGETVSRALLLQEVWRLNLSANSNSMAVQLSRLRGKLSAVGLPGLIAKVEGGYSFEMSVATSVPPTVGLPPELSGYLSARL